MWLLTPTFIICIYLIISLRIWVKLKLNDFKRKSTRLILTKEQSKMFMPLANFAIVLLIIFWPAFFIFYPRYFFRGFILNEIQAVNKLSFVCGLLVGVTLAFFRKLLNKLE